MEERPALPRDPQSILRLARTDRVSATRAIEALSLEAQSELVCAAPLARRADLLTLLPSPEDVIPLLPEAELCFTAKAIGVSDAAWFLEYATPEQLVAAIDLDVWRGNRADRGQLEAWLDALSLCEDASFLRAVQSLDAEMVVLYLKSRIHCVQKPDDDDGWDQPDGSLTLDDAFYFTARSEKDDLQTLQRMLRELFTADYWFYFRLMQGIIHELDIANEEWALRWRTGRLEDLGFPPWDRAMEIYQFIRPEQRGELPEAPSSEAADPGEWQLPVYIPELPASSESPHLLFRALASASPSQRRIALYALIALANKIAVTDGMELGDAESIPRAIEKAAIFASAGLDYIASHNDLDASVVVTRVPLPRLFGVGANLDPDAARPQPSEAIDDDDEADEPGA